MTTEEKISALRAMGETDADEILVVYLDLAKQKILNRMYPYIEDYGAREVPIRYESVQLNIANYLLNKRGAEGQIQHIENGIHRNYGDADVPESMLKDVTPYCRVLW